MYSPGWLGTHCAAQAGSEFSAKIKGVSTMAIIMTFYKGRPGAGAGSAGRVHAAHEDQVQFLVLIQVSTTVSSSRRSNALF